MRKFESNELQHQYEHDSDFRQKVHRSQNDYSTMMLKAKQLKDFGNNIHDLMIEKFMTENGQAIYFFYGYLQPPPNRFSKLLLLYFVLNFQPEPGVQFTFVYFNNKTPSSDYYFEFKHILGFLPLRILQKMKSFYLVQPYFYIKAYDYIGLGSIHKFFGEHYHHVDTCTDLVKYLKITVHDFVTFVPEEISQEFPSNLKKRPSLLTYRINLQGQNMTQEQLKERRDFQSSIKALITKQIYKLENYEVGEIGVPVILQVLVNYFKAKPQGLRLQGIFRKSVSIDEEKETLDELSRRNYDYIINHVNNPHLIASLIKKFFSNLKVPIIPYKSFQQLMNDQKATNKKQYIKQIIHQIPNLNRLTLTFIIEFLKKDVITQEKQSKMNAHNLAICFSPAFMRSQKASMADLVFAGKSVNVTDMLISEFDDIFGNQQERSKMYQKNMKNRNIDFKKTMRQQLDIEYQRESEQISAILTFSQNSGSIKIQQTQIKPQQQTTKEQHIQPPTTLMQTHSQDIISETKQAKNTLNIASSTSSCIISNKLQFYDLGEQSNHEEIKPITREDLVKKYLKQQGKAQTHDLNQPHKQIIQPKSQICPTSVHNQKDHSEDNKKK